MTSTRSMGPNLVFSLGSCPCGPRPPTHAHHPQTIAYSHNTYGSRQRPLRCLDELHGRQRDKEPPSQLHTVAYTSPLMTSACGVHKPSSLGFPCQCLTGDRGGTPTHFHSPAGPLVSDKTRDPVRDAHPTEPPRAKTRQLPQPTHRLPAAQPRTPTQTEPWDGRSCAPLSDPSPRRCDHVLGHGRTENLCHEVAGRITQSSDVPRNSVNVPTPETCPARQIIDGQTSKTWAILFTRTQELDNSPLRNCRTSPAVVRPCPPTWSYRTFATRHLINSTKSEAQCHMLNSQFAPWGSADE